MPDKPPTMRERFYLNMLNKYVGDKPVKDDAASLFRGAATQMAIMGGAELLGRALLRKTLPMKAQLGIGKFLRAKNPGKIRYYDPVGTTLNIVGSGVAGIYGSMLRKRVQDAKSDPSQSDVVLKTLRGLTSSQRQVVKSKMGKTAGFISSAARATAGGLTGGSFARRMYGMASGSRFSVPQRVFGTAMKAGAAYGIYRGGKAIYNIDRKSRYQNNYTSLLRNNMLAGRIRPEELSQEDASSVQRLGMQ